MIIHMLHTVVGVVFNDRIGTTDFQPHGDVSVVKVIKLAKLS